MSKTLLEYADWLDERGLIWPAPPKPQPAKATPFVKPLKGVRAVTWSLYGTLLRIADGRLLFEPSQPLRIQVALEKAIKEFNMWFSMSRKPGAPWEYMLVQYRQLVEQAEMASVEQKGDFPEVNAAEIWHKLLSRLERNEYDYDKSLYGDLEELSEKVAYFFHASLQGLEASPNALDAMGAISQTSIQQGVLADGQCFSLAQMLRAFRQQGTLPPLGELFAPGCLTFSFQEGVRKPSSSLYDRCRERFQKIGIEPHQILHVGTRIGDDLAAAKRAGMKTALYAADKASLQVSSSELKDPEVRPDRLLTDLAQIRDVLEIR